MKYLFSILSIWGLFSISIIPQSISEVTSWAYQLQNVSIEEIENNHSFDLIVVDYSKDGSNDNRFTDEEISRIKNSGKIAISYISIGEAENYRFYWNESWDANNDGMPDEGAPSWLGNENPNWKGNYKVKFWDDEWKQIVFSYIDTIISQGFDGIYCDIIDAYYYWMEEAGSNTDAAKDMISFVSEIRNYVSSSNSNFYIIPQNGEFIIWENNVTDSARSLYFQSINGIGIEDVFFVGDSDENNPFNPDADRIEILDEYKNQGKKILSIEYLTETDLIETYIFEANFHNYIPYHSVRALDQLFDGISTEIDFNENSLIDNYILFQNYPNPFNPSTIIKYSIPIVETGHAPSVQLKIYDLLGREVATLINRKQQTGNYYIEFDANDLTSGVYYYQLIAGSFVETKKLILLK